MTEVVLAINYQPEVNVAHHFVFCFFGSESFDAIWISLIAYAHSHFRR